MTDLFLKILNMSITSGWVVLLVLVLRFCLKKAPKWITVLLWGLVGIRLFLPFSIESALSLIPSTETISPQIMPDLQPHISNGVPLINSAVNPMIEGSLAPSQTASANPLQILLPVLSLIWVIGVVFMLLYTCISVFRIKRQVRYAVRLFDNVFQCDKVASPFVFGLFRPQIYLPFSMTEEDRRCVIEHEKAHISRGDHLWKPLGFLLLSLHWFNPLIWLSYLLLCRDIEGACDEKVIAALSDSERADYSQALLNCKKRSRAVAACPLAFGEMGVADRIRSVLSYKKPALWIIIVALVLGATAALCTLTDPKKDSFWATYYEGVGTHTDYKGVYLQITGIQIENETRIFSVTWHNETQQTITLTKAFSIEYLDGEDWKDVATRNHTFPEIALVLEPKDTLELEYSSEGFDLSKKGTYRLIAKFGGAYGTWEKFILYDDKESSFSPFGGVDEAQTVLTSAELTRLQIKYPDFFELDTSGGLLVYVWQMAADSYSCALVPEGEYQSEEIWALHKSSATLEEMRAIVSSYGLSREKIRLCPTVMPHSSYAYTIDEAYAKALYARFWADEVVIADGTYSDVMDTALYDIDADGETEALSLSYGPTSGIFSVSLSVFQKGALRYFNIFTMPHADLSFETDEEGKLYLLAQRENKLQRIGIDFNETDVILSSDDFGVAYWGEQGIGSAYAGGGVTSPSDEAIASLLKEKQKEKEPDGFTHLQSYTILAREIASGTPAVGSEKHDQRITFYLLVYHCRFAIGKTISKIDSEFVPTVVTFAVGGNENLIPTEYWTPAKGEDTEAQVRARFPREAADQALNPAPYESKLSQAALQEALSPVER